MVHLAIILLLFFLILGSRSSFTIRSSKLNFVKDKENKEKEKVLREREEKKEVKKELKERKRERKEKEREERKRARDEDLGEGEKEKKVKSPRKIGGLSSPRSPRTHKYNIHDSPLSALFLSRLIFSSHRFCHSLIQ